MLQKGDSATGPLQLPRSAQETERLLHRQSQKLGELRQQMSNTSRQLRSTRGTLQEATDRLAFMQRLRQQRQQQMEQQQQQQQQQVLQALTRLETGFDVGAIRRGTELLRKHTFKAPVQGPLGAVIAVRISCCCGCWYSCCSLNCCCL